MLRALVVAKMPDLLGQYDAYPHNIMRVDFARYLILQQYGGVYCDLDICPLESFDNLLTMYSERGARVLISENATPWQDGQVLTNCFLASYPGAKFWNIVWDVIKNPYGMSPAWKRPLSCLRHFRIIFETGPGVINEAAKAYVRRYPLREGFFNDVVALPRQFVQHSPHWHPKPCVKAGCMAKMLQGASWHELDSRVITRCDQFCSSRWTPSLVVLLLVLICAMMFGRQ